MKKITSLFKRDYQGDRLVYNTVVPGAEWVIEGEGRATEKIDGTCCLIKDGQLYKRYDRKLNKSKARLLKKDKSYRAKTEDYKVPPAGWLAAELEPDHYTGHWPGWVPVGEGPEDRWHNEAFEIWGRDFPNGTYELIGPKVQGNPYKNSSHRLIPHGQHIFSIQPPRNFEGLREWFRENIVEGIVWHHPDGRMAKIKRRDFGLPWPVDGYLAID